MNLAIFLQHHPTIHALLFYMKEKGVNINTAILGLIITMIGFGFKETYSEMRLSHDSMIALKIDVAEIKTNMIPRTEHEMEMSQMRARLAAIEAHQVAADARQSQIEIEIEKLRSK